MTPYYADDAVTLRHGDCLDILPQLPDSSVDAVVTDPPYGLEFMGKDWDRPWNSRGDAAAGAGISPVVMADGYTRAPRPQYGSAWVRKRCTVCGRIGSGGSPCRCDEPQWVVERQHPAIPMRGFQQWTEQWAAEAYRVLKPGGHLLAFGGTRTAHRLTCGIEDAGFEIRDGMAWLYGSGFPKSLDVGDGRGTALKPANEPIVVARKPLSGTVAANLLTHGTGALNIDACRVNPGQAVGGGGGWAAHKVETTDGWDRPYVNGVAQTEGHSAGRWPTNVVLSHVRAWDGADACAGPDGCVKGCPVAELDAQSGVLTSGANPTRRGSDKFRDAYGDFQGQAECTPARGADSGGASRFFPTFRYEAKAPTAERPRTADGVAHPTVKPLDLMRWLVRLVTPPGGTVLEPFAGSGTTAEACVLEGLKCIAIERDATYLPLIRARLAKPLQLGLFAIGDADQAEARRRIGDE